MLIGNVWCLVICLAFVNGLPLVVCHQLTFCALTLLVRRHKGQSGNHQRFSVETWKTWLNLWWPWKVSSGKLRAAVLVVMVIVVVVVAAVLVNRLPLLSI